MCLGNTTTSTDPYGSGTTSYGSGSGSTYGLLNSSGGVNDYVNSAINTNYGSSNINPSFNAGSSYMPTSTSSYYGSTSPSFNYTQSSGYQSPSSYQLPTSLTTFLPSNYKSVGSLTDKFNTVNSTNSLLGTTPSVTATSTTPKTSVFDSVKNGANNLLNTFTNANKSTNADNNNSNMLSNLLKSFAPMLTSLISNPKDTSATSADARTILEGKSATVEGAAARAKMLEYINNPEKIGGTATTDYVKALNADHDYSDAQTLAKFDSDWQAAGYSNTGSDYFKAKSDLQTKLNNARNTEVGAAQAALYQTQLTAQLNMISQQYGIEMQLLQDLMDLDVQTAARKYEMSVKEVDDFRKAVQAMLGVGATQEQA
jgi:hypothetical protein